MNYGWRFVTLYRRKESRQSSQKKKCRKHNGYLIGLTNSSEKKRSESKGEKERYTHLNAEFQRITRDKKAFLSDQCKEIQEKSIERSLQEN